MNQEAIFSLVRSLANFGGGFLVAKGLASDADVQAAVAGLAALAALVWGIYAKRAKPA